MTGSQRHSNDDVCYVGRGGEGEETTTHNTHLSCPCLLRESGVQPTECCFDDRNGILKLGHDRRGRKRGESMKGVSLSSDTHGACTTTTHKRTDCFSRPVRDNWWMVVSEGVPSSLNALACDKAPFTLPPFTTRSSDDAVNLARSLDNSTWSRQGTPSRCSWWSSEKQRQQVFRGYKRAHIRLG